MELRRTELRCGRVGAAGPVLRALTAVALLGSGSVLSLASHAQPGVVVVTPEPIGLVRQFVTTRGDTAAGPDLTNPLEAGLELAKPGELPDVRPPLAPRGIETTTSFQLMQASSLSAAKYDAPVYRPYLTQIAVKPVFTGGVGSATPGSGTPPAPTPDPYAEYMERMEKQQARERRDQLERQSQQRVFELLQGKFEEIAALRKQRKEASEKRLEVMRDTRGPSALGAINLFDGLYVDRGIDLDQSEILRIDHHLYQDANPETGLFYYAPKRYDLQWDPQNQYAMTVIYGMAGQKDGEGEVFMATRLQAGVDLGELQLAENLLRAYLRRNAASGGVTRFRELRPLPLAASSDVELFGGANNEFTVPPDKISVQGITGLLDSMDVSWATDVRRLLNVESLLRTDAGIHGSITMHASGDEKLSRSIPLEIAVASRETFGRIPFDRANGWVNRSRYPVRLESLHALVLAPEDGNGIRKDQPIIFTWDLHDAVVAPGAGIAWDASWVPPWLESRAKTVWVKYGVDGSCDACDDLVFTEKFIPPPPSTRQIQFTTGDAFESTGAYHIRVHVRSPFLDPQRNRVQVQPAVLLEQDGVELPVARLFLTDREVSGQGAQEPFYEFRLEVVMKDGKVHESGWVPSRTLDYLLGSASLREIFGHLPSQDAEPAS